MGLLGSRPKRARRRCPGPAQLWRAVLPDSVAARAEVSLDAEPIEREDRLRRRTLQAESVLYPPGVHCHQMCAAASARCLETCSFRMRASTRALLTCSRAASPGLSVTNSQPFPTRSSRQGGLHRQLRSAVHFCTRRGLNYCSDAVRAADRTALESGGSTPACAVPTGCSFDRQEGSRCFWSQRVEK